MKHMQYLVLIYLLLMIAAAAYIVTLLNQFGGMQ